MKKVIAWSLGLALLGGLAWPAAAQRAGGPWHPPSDGERCACTAGGVDCLFGSAEGCSITCLDGLCECIGAYCSFGFPRPARCRCL